jgi:hypothetical protein
VNPTKRADSPQFLSAYAEQLRRIIEHLASTMSNRARPNAIDVVVPQDVTDVRRERE